jgi:DtxR family Mn-dependent transcriptional regulator
MPNPIRQGTLNFVTSPAPGLSTAVEDYLKAIQALEHADGRVTVSALAVRLGVSVPSATEMSKRLAHLGLVERTPYREIALTGRGRAAALTVVRRHRLLERYLSDRLQVPFDQLHVEAERLEHALSPELEARIDESLGFPALDPHGDPIPDRRLRLERRGERTVAALEKGEHATVAHVPDTDAALLRYLTELGLIPGKTLELLGRAPFGGPIALRTESGEHAIGRELAASIGVR